MTDEQQDRAPVTPEWLRQVASETLHDEDPRGGPICNERCPACALNKAAEALRTATQRADFAEESLRRETVWRSQDKDRIDRLCKRAEKAEFERDQLDSFNPERSMLQAVQKSLHEKDAMLKVAEDEKAVLMRLLTENGDSINNLKDQNRRLRDALSQPSGDVSGERTYPLEQPINVDGGELVHVVVNPERGTARAYRPDEEPKT